MPGVESNTVYECTQCKSKFDFQNPSELRNACPFCGNVDFRQLVVVTVCDFCSVNIDPAQAYSYPCKRFMYDILIAGGPDSYSNGDWAACEECHGLIEADDRKGLAQRNVDMEEERNPSTVGRRQLAYALAIRVHKGFFENRSGPAYRGPPQNTGREE